MKKVLPFLSLVVLMAACTHSSKDSANTQTTTQPSMTIDTTGFAQYQLWKAQHELSNVQEYQQPVQQQQPVAAAPATKVKIIRVPVREAAAPVVSRTSSSRASEQAPVSTPTTESSTTSSSAPSTTDNGNNGSVASTGGAGTTAPAQEPVKKPGMSNKAKDAVIGGVIGGAAGAVINKKNPAVGAVIGAVLGAGGGYMIGKKADQKQGQIIN